MKIAVISDTHNLLRREVVEQLKECDVILHAGDICSPAVYDALDALGKPMLTVRGNNDGKWAVEKGIPDVVDTKWEGLRIFMVHDKRDIPSHVLTDGGGYDLVVFGHSHKYEELRVEKTLFLNPGSCGPVRFRLPVTMAVLDASGGGSSETSEMIVQRIDIQTGKTKSEMREVSPGEMKTLVIRVVKDIKRNKSAAQIAKKYKISLELSEQICRLYLTHPGVTVDGILGKMGL
ncbi:MAG: metallophosphoesterase family protein [Lachnospiraceae bacterium]|nr:metallophosphoesterase family protein [Lachnospiraceae bacterium]